MTPEQITLGAGILLSALASYIPGLNVAFASMSPTAKRLTMLACLVATAVGMVMWQCTDRVAELTFGMCVGGFDWKSILAALFTAAVGNQTADRILPKPEVVEKAAEESRREAGEVRRS